MWVTELSCSKFCVPTILESLGSSVRRGELDSILAIQTHGLHVERRATLAAEQAGLSGFSRCVFVEEAI